MNIDKFGRGSLRGGLKGDPGVVFSPTPEGNFNIRNKRLVNVSDPIDENDVVNKKSSLILIGDAYSARGKRLVDLADPKEPNNGMTLDYYLKSKYNCNSKRLENLADPHAAKDAVNKMYVDTLNKNTKSQLKAKIKDSTSGITALVNNLPAMVDNKIASSNCLMMDNEGNFTAKKRRIADVAAPEANEDAVNNRFVQNMRLALLKKLEDHKQIYDEEVKEIRKTLDDYLLFKNVLFKANAQLWYRFKEEKKARDGASSTGTA